MRASHPCAMVRAMRKFIGVCLAFCAAIALGGATVAGASDEPIVPKPEPTVFGVLDDYGKYSDDGGTWFFGEMNTIGLTENKITVNWDPARPETIAEQAFLDRVIPIAVAHGIKVSLGVGIGKARAITGDPRGAVKFAAFLKLLALRYPEVKEYVIANEPNLSRFWQPQYNRNGRMASAPAYTGLLARSYDTLKEIDPEITVVGLSLSPRGNGNPRAKSNISTQPVKFIREMGRAYRASGRRRPLMDVLGFHPYPASNRATIDAGYAWPNAGFANLDRIKQAVWDAFHGTAQPTFAEGPPDEIPPESGLAIGSVEEPKPLTFKLDEVGWQVRIPASSRAAYHGRESVTPTTEARQARIYGQLVRRAVCDRSIAQLLFFGLVDEANLDRWQAGLIRADRTPRSSYSTVRYAIAQTGGLCAGDPTVWEHTEEVVGARANFGAPGRPFTFTASAEEDAMYKAALFRVSGPAISREARSAITRSLASSSIELAAPASSGRLRAYSKTVVRLRERSLAPGYYAYAIRFSAAMNAERWSVVVSNAFRVR